MFCLNLNHCQLEIDGNVEIQQISESIVNEYLIQLNNLNAKTIFEQINFLTGDYEPILMTHGNKSSFCRRHIVAKWFENELEL